MRQQFVSYFGFLFQPFFRWWWAAVTGFASIFGVLVTPQQGLVLKPSTVALIIFAAFTLAFLTLSTLIQGWKLYRGRYTDLRVLDVQKTKEHGGEYVALVCGDVDVQSGTLAELRRQMGGTDAL